LRHLTFFGINIVVTRSANSTSFSKSSIVLNA
jgi:hypothetical protein